MSKKLNDFSTDRYEILFSNIPKPKNYPVVDLDAFNDYILGVNLPGTSIQLNSMYGPHGIIRHNPTPKMNQDMENITISLRMDEDCYNWFTLKEYLGEIRNNRSVSGEEYLHRSNINELTIKVKDNQIRTTRTLVVRNVLIESLSSIQLGYSSSELGQFEISCKYDGISLR